MWSYVGRCHLSGSSSFGRFAREEKADAAGVRGPTRAGRDPPSTSRLGRRRVCKGAGCRGPAPATLHRRVRLAGFAHASLRQGLNVRWAPRPATPRGRQPSSEVRASRRDGHDDGAHSGSETRSRLQARARDAAGPAAGGHVTGDSPHAGVRKFSAEGFWLGWHGVLSRPGDRCRDPGLAWRR